MTWSVPARKPGPNKRFADGDDEDDETPKKATLRKRAASEYRNLLWYGVFY